MISVQIKADEVHSRLRTLARKLQDRRAVNKALAASMFRMVIDNFEDEAHDGKPWAPLNPRYEEWKRRKGKTKVLQFTGQLRQSFLPFSDNNQAGVGALSVLAHADISKKHEEGIGVPKRPMLPGRVRALEEGLVIYQHFVERLTKGQ